MMNEVASRLVAQSASPWWRGATIYQVYPRSFADSNGDGVGDLAGITAHLDYIAGLGVDMVWLSPFFKSPMRDFGYDVADYCDVDPIFGSLGDFDALISRAHALGLKVIIDQVYAHTSDEHNWFKDSRASRNGAKADWYVWADAKPDGSPPSNWQSVFGGPAWTWARSPGCIRGRIKVSICCDWRMRAATLASSGLAWKACCRLKRRDEVAMCRHYPAATARLMAAPYCPAKMQPHGNHPTAAWCVSRRTRFPTSPRQDFCLPRGAMLVCPSSS